MPGEPNPWYSEGLRFQCTQCGACCTTHGEYSFVYLMEPEVEALAAHLELATEDFRARYCDRDEGWTVLRTDRPECPFLGPDKTCQVYPVRPFQCRTWPFWKDNIENPARWNGEVKKTCPGIGTGPLYSAEEIAETARRTEEWYEAE